MNSLFRNISDTVFLEKQNLSKFMTIKLDFVGSLITCNTLVALQKVLQITKEHNIKYRMIGLGANQVLTNSEILYIKLELPEIHSNDYCENYTFSASTSISKLTSLAIKFNLKGWEAFTGIPGTVGGSICMNAGTSLGEIGRLVEKVWILDSSGIVKTKVVDASDFTYRKNLFLKKDEIIIKAQIKHLGIDEKVSQIIKKYLRLRNETQPLGTKNCGSVFKNPSIEQRAGMILDQLGMKGFGSKKLHISHKHANFIEHEGGATTEDFKNLVMNIKKEVKEKTGIEFELEVKLD